MLPFNEKYEITPPIASIHNLVVGTTYIDLGGNQKIRCITEPGLEANIRYTKRGWFSKEEFKVEGEVSR